MTQNELNRILKLHKKWILNGEGNGVRANLTGADLTGAYLTGADLTGAYLSNADLTGAILDSADLTDADLTGAYLTGAYLSNANLTGAILDSADLTGADLTGAYLSNADLTGAILDSADLTDADLRLANLTGASLSNAKLKGVYADETTAFFHLQCPEEGSYIAYKKGQEERIVKLLIHEDAKRSSATTRKCRASKAKVLSITNIDGTENFEETISCYDSEFIYKVGEIVEVKDFNEDRWNECSNGIHHFMTRKEAVDYNF